MKIRKLEDEHGFSHDIMAVLFIALFAIVGTAYLVATHAATPTGHITSELTAGGASLCLNVPGQGNVNFSAIDSAICNSSVNTQNWQAKPTKQTNISGQTVQAYALAYNGGKYCAGVNGVNGVLAPVTVKSPTGVVTVLEPKVELFGCRANQASFDSSYQQWAVVNGMLENVNPNAVYNGSRMCMTATGPAASVELIACTNQAGQKWTLPIANGGTTPPTTKPSTPTSVTAVAKSATSVAVSWHASTDSGGPGLAGYAVFRGGKELSTVPSGLSYTDNTAAAGTSYSYTVEAYDKATPAIFSASSAAATVTTPSAPGGGSPTPTSSVSCNYQTDTWSGDASKVGYSVTKVSSKDGNPASFSVKLNASKGTTEVVGYPSDQCLMYSAMPSVLTSSFNDTPPASSSGLDYEYAYDIWLTTATAAKANNWNNDLELMIWNFVNGQVPAGSVKGSLSDGSKVWVAGNNTDGTVSVVLPKNETSGTVNIASIVSQLESAGYVTKSDNGILDVEYGIEAPYGGGQTFTVNSLSVAE